MAHDDVAGEAHKSKQRIRASAHATDERPAIDRLYSAYRDLLAHGWQDAMYAPKDGTEIEIIEMGSTGIHKVAWASFDHKPLDSCSCFFGDAEGYPSHPVLFRKLKVATI